MHRHIIYIINPVSGVKKKDGLKLIIEEETRKKQIPFGIFPSVESGDYSFLEPIIEENKTTDIVIAGGDGTISRVVGNLRRFDGNIGIIPCGSGNGLAFTAGIPKDPVNALEIIFEGRSAPVDGFMVNDQFACMLCGLGFDATVAHGFAHEQRRGLQTYVKQVMKNFMAAKTYHFRLELDKKKIETDAYFISIANSNQFGNNFTIAPQASLSDGLLDVVIVASSGKMNMILQTISQVAGWNQPVSEMMVKEKKAVIYFQTKKLLLYNPEEALMHIDGDPVETADKIKVKVLEKYFRLIQP